MKLVHSQYMDLKNSHVGKLTVYNCFGFGVWSNNGTRFKNCTFVFYQFLYRNWKLATIRARQFDLRQ